MSSEFDLDDFELRMDGAVDHFKTELSGLRTGRASVNLLDPVTVEAYGSRMQMNQVGTVSTPEARLISVQVWDKSMVSAVEKAIRNSGLGLNPVVDGDVVRIPIPELNEERRRDLTKIAGKYAEQTRIAVRNVRRDAMDTLKRMEKDSDISQDEHKSYGDDVQKLTDVKVKEIDELLAKKEQEIMQI